MPSTNATPSSPLAYSIKGVTEQTGLSRAYVNTLIKTGQLKARKTGRRVLVLRTELERFLSEDA